MAIEFKKSADKNKIFSLTTLITVFLIVILILILYWGNKFLKKEAEIKLSTPIVLSGPIIEWGVIADPFFRNDFGSFPPPDFSNEKIGKINPFLPE